MLVTLKQVLEPARRGRYCVPGFNCTEDVMVRTLLETASSLRSPIIMMVIESDLAGNGWTYLAGLIKLAAAHHDVPVVLHLDHGTNIEVIRQAINYGFTSVMIDGSVLPYEENVAITREVVELAAPHGISVEAELGHVGGANLTETFHAANVLTEPVEVERFVAETGIDALAVSIGTSHGMYRAEPALNIDRLDELDAVSKVPLVLHGGSGTPDNQIARAVKHGICKMNVYSDLRVAMGIGIKRSIARIDRPDPLPEELFGPIREALAETISAKIELCGSAGKADA